MIVEDALTEALILLANPPGEPTFHERAALYCLVRLAWLSERITNADVGVLLGVDKPKHLTRKWTNQGIVTGPYYQRGRK
jgi:hypothetical protein